MNCLYRFVLWFSWCFLRLFFRLRIYGQEHYYDGAGVIAANHASYLDPVILSAAWPEEVHFLAKEPLFKIFFFGWLIRKLNSHPLKGSANDFGVIRQICGLLNKGKKVVLFPEGQRSLDDKLLPIKPGIALLVSKTNSAIIPTYIFGTFEAWPSNKRVPCFGKKIGCVFGSPIKWTTFAHLEKREAQEALAKTLTDAIHALKIWYESGAEGSPP